MSILEEIKVNRAPTHMVRPAGLELQKKTKVIMGEYVEREKLDGEAKGAENDLWQRPVYRSGDGDSMRQVPRAGSLDAFGLSSRGHRTWPFPTQLPPNRPIPPMPFNPDNFEESPL